MEILIAYYTVGALASFSVCFKAFVEDSTTPLTDQTSWGVLALTSVFWPITIPISWLELVTKSEMSIVHSSNDGFTKPCYHPDNLRVIASPSPDVQPLSKTVNFNQPRFLPLGYLLRQAGLITEFQIKAALNAQKNHLHHLRLGQILVYQGLIEPETIKFFVEDLLTLHQNPQKKPLSEYLKMAKLLDDQQIEEILTEKPQTNLQFGALAVQKGWVKQDTINLVLHYLGDQYKKALQG
jgi:hypothetical protein